MLWFLVLYYFKLAEGLLRPQDSETRQTYSLNGVWRFRLGESLNPSKGFNDGWSKVRWRINESLPMPVPSSYNDVTQSKEIRDYVGWVWYQRTFFSSWASVKSSRRIYLRFDSAHYTTNVWLNGHLILEHYGGHLPFEAEVTEFLKAENLLTVAVNNTLNRYTLPQGNWNWHINSGYPKGYFTLDYNFDFFNYAGIHRNVILHSSPKVNRIADVRIHQISVTKNLSEASLLFSVKVDNKINDYCTVEVIREDGKVAIKVPCSFGFFNVPNPRLWWPYLASPPNEAPGYLYTLKVTTSDDIYRLRIGIRDTSLSKENGFFINHKKFYFRGFGKHEDADIRGKGLDLPTIIKDFSLIRWIGANSFRTSHYPYAEEILDMADEQGIVVISECPGVALDFFDDPLLNNHIKKMEEMIDRDKNRPSVVAWSIANEPRSSKPKAKAYFKAVAEATRKLDPSRPVMIVLNAAPEDDLSSEFVDIVGLNKYAAWYSNTGHTELITEEIIKLIVSWWTKRKTPIMFTEYGADTIAGFHQDPSFVFTEEYQTKTMVNYFRAFNTIKTKSDIVFIGEMIWNFADFMTKESITRPLGNRKGIFTRQRQPKMAAHLLKQRYWRQATLSIDEDQNTVCFALP